jgi:Ribosomal protein L23
MKKNPYDVIKTRHITEKATVLGQLASSTSNKCTARCKSPKYVFRVAACASKQAIAHALEEIYAEKKINVVKVNTIRVKPKARRVRGFKGFKPGFKKAVVTLKEGQALEDV